MKDYIIDYEEDEPIRQGDLIRRKKIGDQQDEWGFVLTADCDIAQKKSKNHISYLEIVPTSEYISKIWIPDQIIKIKEKQIRTISDKINSILKKSEGGLSVTIKEMQVWIDESGPEIIKEIMSKKGGSLDKKTMDSMYAVHLCSSVKVGENNIGKYIKIKTLLNATKDSIRSDINSAMNGKSAFADYFIIPEMPRAEGVGFAVLLRSIRSIREEYLFENAVKAQLSSVDAGFYRIGRLSDSVRFAITQKMTFLFSRIGLPTKYEDECDSAVDLFSSGLSLEEVLP